MEKATIAKGFAKDAGWRVRMLLMLCTPCAEQFEKEVLRGERDLRNQKLQHQGKGLQKMAPPNSAA